MAEKSVITAHGKLETWVRYNTGVPISSVLVDAQWRNSTKTLSSKRKMPTDPLRAKTALRHSLSIRTDSTFGGAFGNKVFQKSVHQAANLSKDLAFPMESEGTNDLENRLRNKLRGEMANLGQMLAEYDKTAKLFGDLAQDIANMYWEAKPRKRKKRPKSRAQRMNDASKDAANRELQLVYGVMPLVSDMVTSIKLMQEAGLKMPVLQATVGRRIYAEQVKKTYFEPVPYDVRTVVNEYRCMRKVRLTAICELNWQFLFSTLGQTGLTNPFSLAYELVPWSFVLDWWINVGDVLASLDNILYFGTITVQTSETKYWIKRSAVGGTAGVFSQKSYTRSAPRTIPPINTLAYKPGVNLQHVLNGAALLRQLV